MNWQKNMISGKQRTGSWRNDPITDKQKEMINSIYNACKYLGDNLNEFKGTTKGEACDYISKYSHFLQMASDSYALEHDLDNAGDRI